MRDVQHPGCRTHARQLTTFPLSAGLQGSGPSPDLPLPKDEKHGGCEGISEEP